MKPDLFQYGEPVAYLRDVYAHKRGLNPRFSVRAWAEKMSFSNHTLLSFFLNRNRPIQPKHIEKICKGLDLTDKERLYFDALIHFHAATSESEKRVFELVLNQFHPEQQFTWVELEKFKLIANWYHMAILEMTQLKDFSPDPKWVAGRLGGKISVQEITDAVERLISLGLLREDEKGKLTKTHARISTPKDRPSEAIRAHHKQVLDLGKAAIDEQAVNIRDYNSCAMTVDSSKMEDAKKLIQEFRTNMGKLMEKAGGDETYQLSVQFFRLTNSEGEQKQ